MHLLQNCGTHLAESVHRDGDVCLTFRWWSPHGSRPASGLTRGAGNRTTGEILSFWHWAICWFYDLSVVVAIFVRRCVRVKLFVSLDGFVWPICLLSLELTSFTQQSIARSLYSWPALSRHERCLMLSLCCFVMYCFVVNCWLVASCCLRYSLVKC